MKEARTSPATFDEVVEGSNLTRRQVAVWLSQMLQPAAPLWNLAGLMRVEGPMDAEAYIDAQIQVMAESAALRTGVTSVGGIPRGTIQARVGAPPELLDFSHQSESRAISLARDRCSRAFDLSFPPVDHAIMRLGPKLHLIYLNHHHLVNDAVGIVLFTDRAWQIHDHQKRGGAGDLEPLPRFEAFVDHDRGWRKPARLAAARRYWAQALADPPPVPPFFEAGAGRVSSRAHRWSIGLDSERFRRLGTVSDAEGGAWSQPQIFLVALARLIKALGGHSRVAIATSFHNRRTAAFKRTIGNFMEFIPLHLDCGDDSSRSLESLKEQIWTQQKAAFRYGMHGMEGYTRGEDFAVVFNYQVAAFGKSELVPERQVRWLSPGHAGEFLGLSVHDLSHAGRLVIEFDFKTAAFDRRARHRIVDAYAHELDQVLGVLGGEWLHSGLPRLEVPVDDVDAESSPQSETAPVPKTALDALSEEIARALERLPLVEGVALRLEPSGDETRLIAFVQASGSPSTLALRRYLAERDVPIPDEIVLVDVLPQGPCASGAPSKSAAVAVPPALLAALLLIVEEVLELRGVSARDDFIKIGGNSLLTLVVTARIREELGVDVIPEELFVRSLGEVAERIHLGRQMEGRD